MTLLLVAAGAAVGAPLRFLAGHHLDRRLPWGTLLVNLAGSFLLGVFTALSLSGEWVTLVGTGFCGALTTYSAFAVQVVDAGGRRGVAYAVLTVLGAVALCGLGFWLGSGPRG